MVTSERETDRERNRWRGRERGRVRQAKHKKRSHTSVTHKATKIDERLM